VRYYNARLVEVFKKHGRALLFTFVSGQRQWRLNQYRANQKLQILIEKIKRDFTSDYGIRTSADEQTQLLKQVLAEILSAMNPQWQNDAPLQNLVEDAVTSMILPPQLPAESLSSSIRRLWAKQGPPDAGLLVLRSEIGRYIQGSIVSQVRHLQQVAAVRESDRDGYHAAKAIEKEVFDPACTFALVAGQASQFAPLKAALRAELRRLLPESNIGLLSGSLAKEACCRGAVKFQISRNRRMNPEEIFGTFAFMAEVHMNEEVEFMPLDMRKLKQEGSCSLENKPDTTYWLVYSPRVSFPEGAKPRLFDGTTATVCQRVPESGKFLVEYDPVRRALSVNGRPASLATYGDINQSIYPKVWPEVCEEE
jgi:hypothetical protein